MNEKVFLVFADTVDYPMGAFSSAEEAKKYIETRHYKDQFIITEYTLNVPFVDQEFGHE